MHRPLGPRQGGSSAPGRAGRRPARRIFFRMRQRRAALRGRGERERQAINGRLVSDAQPLESFVRLRGGLRGRTDSNASAPASGDRMPEAGAALAGVFRSNDQLV